MALFSLTTVASDNSASASTLFLNPEFVSSTGTPTAGEIASFPTAVTALTYRALEQNTMRVRRYLSATALATLNSAITAASAGILGGGVSGDATLVAGTVNVPLSGVTTATKVVLTRHTVGGTVTATVQYQYVVTTGNIAITAAVAAGTINTADTSVITYAVVG